MTASTQAAIATAIASLLIVAMEGCAPGTKIWVVADDSRPAKTSTPGRSPRPLAAVGLASVAKKAAGPVIAIDDEAEPLDGITDDDKKLLAKLLKALK